MEAEEENNFLTLDERVERHTEVPVAERQDDLRQSKGSLDQPENNAVTKLKHVINENLPGCDILVCIFLAALKSFKVDQCLRPFPQSFIKENNEKDFLRLKNACNQIPPLTEFLKLPATSISNDVVVLLTWLFIESKVPSLKIHNSSVLPLSIINEKASINALPQFIFNVNYSPKLEEEWKNRIGTREIFYAFHGSCISNFYSILKFGLQQHFSRGKEVIFGSGIYLSNEISVCTNYSPFRKTWKNSILGHKHSIIAICEVINDEDEVKCKDEKNKKRAHNQNSFGEIPEKYFIVTNSELVKVKYLLVYRFKNVSVVKSFIRNNFLWIIIILYFLMLILIGFFNGPLWRKFARFMYSYFE